MKKQMDDAVFYAEVQRDLDVVDPLGGETPADKELRISTAKHDASMRALKEIVTNGWSRSSAAPLKKVKGNGQGTRRVS